MAAATMSTVRATAPVPSVGGNQRRSVIAKVRTVSSGRVSFLDRWISRFAFP
ncbi:hypothetical protein N9L76_09980 [bacterium]|nr:hypothetical protein [bacterium]